ncbi:MAG: hypothetical protein AABZ31_10255 [Bdellovibrionota bacterium]
MKTKIAILGLALAFAQGASAGDNGSYLSCSSDKAVVEIDEHLEYIVYQDVNAELAFVAKNPDVEIKSATDLGFTAKQKSVGAYLMFRERSLSAEDKAAGVEVQYHIQGWSSKIETKPSGKSATEVLQALAEFEKAKVDTVAKCKRVHRPI